MKQNWLTYQNLLLGVWGLIIKFEVLLFAHACCGNNKSYLRLTAPSDFTPVVENVLVFLLRDE